MYLFSFFFFKQKTAYEMRISDWSSDVCSSDLAVHHPLLPDQPIRLAQAGPADRLFRRDLRGLCVTRAAGHDRARHRASVLPAADRPAAARDGPQRSGRTFADRALSGGPCRIHGPAPRQPSPRSEEHTSELQSLMRISYAVFCLKKKKT